LMSAKGQKNGHCKKEGGNRSTVRCSYVAVEKERASGIIRPRLFTQTPHQKSTQLNYYASGCFQNLNVTLFGIMVSLILAATSLLLCIRRITALSTYSEQATA